MSENENQGEPQEQQPQEQEQRLEPPPEAPRSEQPPPGAGSREESRAAAVAGAAAKATVAAGQDAFRVLLKLLGDPVGKLPKAYADLGPKRALAAGIIFGAIYALCLIVGGALLSSLFARTAYGLDGTFKASSGVTFGGLVRLFVAGAASFLSLALGSLICRTVFGGRGSAHQDFFAAGAALLPVAAYVLVMGIFARVPLLVAAVTPFAFSFTVLMLYAAATELAGLGRRAASFAVPGMFLVAGVTFYVAARVLGLPSLPFLG